MTRWIALLSCLLLLGCAPVTPVLRPDLDVFRDQLFEPPATAPDITGLFTLSPAMQRFLAERIEPQVRRKGAQRALLDALYAQGELQLEYDASFTRTAAQAFDARRGNCLSLVIMTAAFARELGLNVRFQEVLDQAAIEPNGELTFVVGHVNLALLNGARQTRAGGSDQAGMLVDFLPGQDLHRQRTREIAEQRIRAQFMNNRAAEELARGRVHDAYGWLRAAWTQDPGYVNLYNTLGIIYRHRGALPEAERALQAALTLDPGNEHVAGNLAGVQVALGRPGAIAAAPTPGPGNEGVRLHQARLALQDGRSKEALRLLQGELGLTPRNPDLHHWLAVAYGRLGHSGAAQRHLELAAEFSRNGEQRQLYAGKLERLKAQAGLHLQ